MFALFRINSAYFEIKSLVIPAILRPPNDADVGKLVATGFFFGLFAFVALSGCIVTTGFRLGIGLFVIPLIVGIMLNDVGKSRGKFILADDKSVHNFFCWANTVVLDLRFISADLCGFVVGMADGCDGFGVIVRLGVIVS